MFNRIIVLGIDSSDNFLDANFWQRMKPYAKEIIFFKTLDNNTRESRSFSDAIKDSDCILTFLTNVDRNLIEKAKNLKYIGILTTGSINKVDTDFARKNGIVVSNIPSFSTTAVSEFVLASLLEHLRDLNSIRLQLLFQNRRSEEGLQYGREIKGKTFGILGMGNIGQRVARLALAYDANVIYWSKSRKPEIEKLGAKHCCLDDLISTSDFISINLPLNDHTEQLLNANRITSIKNGAVIINTCLLELMDMEATYQRLLKNEISLIFDHADHCDIPLELFEKLKPLPNCKIYPPIAYYSAESKMLKQDTLMKNISSFLEGKPINVVNNSNLISIKKDSFFKAAEISVLQNETNNLLQAKL